MNKSFLCLLVSCIVFVGCTQTEQPVAKNRFADAKLQRIYDLQDRQETKQLIPLLKSKQPQHREAAVLAFASIQDSNAVRFIRESLLTDSDPRVRKAAAYAIGQMRDSVNVPTLFMALENEIDQESRKYILESLGKSANSQVVQYFNNFNSTVTQLREGHARGMCRALYQRQIGDSFARNCLRYFDIVSSDETKFYAAHVLARLPKDATEAYSTEIVKLLESHGDGEIHRLLSSIVNEKEAQAQAKTWVDIRENLSAYEQKPYVLVKDLRAMKLTNDAVEQLRKWAFDHRYQVVRTTAAELCFKDVNTGHDKKIGPGYTEFIERCLASRDMALQSLACVEIASNPHNRWMDLLLTYRDSLSMPRQMETYVDIEKAIAAIKKVKYQKPSVAFNHPIDWSYVKEIPRNQRVKVETTKGVIVLELKVDDAPGSVANFLQQVDQQFYDSKYFHRVVPNFVIQAGCVRGDGWGAPDWTQRSEFSNYLTYTTGAVGLASVGKDTEGVQLFITHNSTPFLDGRYSIFGYVVEGMDVVHKIDIGDQIIQIIKLNQTK